MARWPQGLRGLTLKARDLSFEGDLLGLHVREGKGCKPKIVPIHPEVRAALTSVLEFGNVGGEDKLIRASRSRADRWIKRAAAGAMDMGVMLAGRRISNHTLRHS